MLTVTDVSLQFAGSTLYKHVDLKFAAGNCYGIIGANGAGKSTLLRILSGALEPTTGSVTMGADDRMSVLEQDHFKYDEYNVMDTVIMGNRRLYDIMKEKEALYAKEDFTDADGEKAAELEGEFAEMNGWEAETEADQLLNGLGIPMDLHTAPMSALDGRQKVKVLLAQALFGRPSIVLLDEPTNGLDIESIDWLEEFLMDYPGTIIVVSHDRHFLNAVCTHIVDIDFTKIRMYVGNYDFWYDASQLMQNLMKNQNKKNEEKAQELKEFISRFSANKSKSKQATARRKLLEKITLEEIPASSRRYPWVAFSPDREVGKDILFVTDVSKTIDGVKVLDKVSFIVGHGDKIAFVGENENAQTALFQILTGELEPDEGTVKWGQTATFSYFPKDNTKFFKDCDDNLVEWLRQWSSDPHEAYLRGFLGRMLFSGDDVYKPVKVLSGGEKVRCMLSRMMLSGANVLLLDQPTNHLDLESREALVEALNAFDGTLLMVAHDRYLLSEVADEAWSMDGDGITVYKEGFAEYDVARRAALAASKAGKEREKDAGRKAEGPVPGKALDREELKRLKREQAEQRNALYKKMRPKQEAYAKLETQLEALLTEQSDVEAALADPEVYADGNKTTELLKKFSQLKESSEQALEKLGELEAELAELEAQRAALSMNGGGDEL